VTLSGVDFDANTANVNGGAIHVTSGNTGITGGSVTDNVALQEGGGFWNQGGAMTVTEVTFTGNDAQGSLAAQGGGALFQQPTGSLTVTDSTIGTVEDPNTATGLAAPDGGGNGGGILTDQGPLTVTDSMIVGNTANRAGGGIESNSATITVSGTTFTANDATVNGGAIHVSGTGTSGITGGTVSDNDAGQEGGGFWNNAGTMTVTSVDFDGNDAAGSGAAQGGGALFQQPNGRVDVTDSVFTENTATGLAAPDGGGNGGAILNDQGLVQVFGSDFSSNTANRAGGAIEANLGTTAVVDVDAEDNSATVNGGVLHISGAGTVTVADLRADGNTATNEGGALWNSATGALTVERSQLTANDAGVDGGAVFSTGGDTAIINTTISGNSAGATGGGIADVAGADTSIRYVTAVDNSAPLGGNAQINGTLTSFASVLAYPGGDDNCDVVGTVTSDGFNHADDASCGFGSGQDDQGDPLLGPLRDNGGSSFTHFPLSGSPLVNRVPSGSCVQTEDQRTVNRPFGPGCDTGAIEGVFPGHGFSDSTPFYEEAIRWTTSAANDPQILVGYNNGTFRPNLAINRGQTARMIYNEAGAPDVSSYPPSPFTDVTPFFEDAVRYAAAEGIFLGYEGNRCTSRGLTSPCFIERDAVTRGQLVRAKYQFAGAPDVSGLPEVEFSDSTPFFEDAIRWAAANDLVTGYSDGTFRPNASMTRGNAARVDYLLARSPAAWDDPDSAPLQMLFRPSVETLPPPP
jgi:predicted outer membrane repeat protein